MYFKLRFEKIKTAIRQVVFIGMIAVIGLTGCGKTEEETTESTTTEQIDFAKELTVWYTDHEIAAYMNAAANAFLEETGVQIHLEEMSTIDYLENINQANLSEEQSCVDVYILNSNQLEKAYLAGLVAETNKTYEEFFQYPDPAINACIWKGKSFGYPFYYETSFFLYNKNFIENCPDNFQEILDFSVQYGADGTTYEGIETILKWDVQNLYYNYGFAGAYLNLGGPYGDDASVIDLTNDSVIEALSFYKQLNQRLYFEASESDYDVVLEDFLNGKLLYTIAGTQSLSKLEEAYAAGISYGIAPLLDMTESLRCKAISTNYLAQVNPYGVSEATAEAFAVFLTDTYVENLYELTGKLSCKPMESYENPEIVHIEEAYANSVQLPKLMKTTDYWMELELAFRTIWNTGLDYQGGGEGSEEENAEQEAAVMEEIRSIVRKEMEQVKQHVSIQIGE